MQSENRMVGVDAKVERAKQLLADLAPQIAHFVQSNPLAIQVTDEPTTGDQVYRVQTAPQLPPAWATMLGDILHNLRSSLDHLAWQLVLANGEVPDRQTAFPVTDSARQFEQSIGRMRGVSGEAIRLIRASRPYRGGNDLLWQLHQLDIIDKHRLLVPVGAAYRSLTLDFGAGLRRLIPDSEIPELPLSLSPEDRLFPLQDGEEVFRIMAAARSSDDLNPQFAFDVAFGDGDIVQGESLVPTLQRIVEMVVQIMETFRPLLS